jgi:NAD-dependent deacetylase
VLEIHGAIRRVRCTGCGAVEDRGTEPLADLPECAECGSLLRPDVVWFEESLPYEIWFAAEEAVRSCECCMVIGTSAIVYPAAGLVQQARENDASVIEINLTATDASRYADVCLHGPSGKILPELIRRIS